MRRGNRDTGKGGKKPSATVDRRNSSPRLTRHFRDSQRGISVPVGGSTAGAVGAMFGALIGGPAGALVGGAATGVLTEGAKRTATAISTFRQARRDHAAGGAASGSSLGGVRTDLSLAQNNAMDGMDLFLSAKSCFEQARDTLAKAMDGSGRSDAADSRSGVDSAIVGLKTAIDQVKSGCESYEEFAGSL